MYAKKLKIKAHIKGLAEESKSLRQEILKHTDSDSVMYSLQIQRSKVRRKIRHFHLLYGFLNGLEYSEIERSTRQRPSWSYLERLAAEWWITCGQGGSARKEDLKEWINRANEYLNSEGLIRS